MPITYRLHAHHGGVTPFTDSSGESAAIDIFYGAKLGEGSYGRVYRVTYRDQAQASRFPPLVVKEFDFSNRTYSYYKKVWAREIKVFHRIYGRQPLLYHRLDDSRGHYKMLMLELPGINLHTYLEENKPAYLERLKILIAILQAVKAMHDKQVIHGDLKAENFHLVQDKNTGEYRIVSLDFGMSYLSTEEATTNHNDCQYWTRDRVFVREGGRGPIAHPFQDIFSLLYMLCFFEKGFDLNLIKVALYCFDELQESTRLHSRLRKERVMPKSTRDAIYARLGTLYANRRLHEEGRREAVKIDDLISRAQNLLQISVELKEYCIRNFNLFALRDIASIINRLKATVEFRDRVAGIEQVDHVCFEEIKQLCDSQLRDALYTFFLKDENLDLARLTIPQIRARLSASPIFLEAIDLIANERIVRYTRVTAERQDYINKLIFHENLQFIINYKTRPLADFLSAIPVSIAGLYQVKVKNSLTEDTVRNMVAIAEGLLALSETINAYCQTNFITAGVYYNLVNFKLFLKGLREFSAQATAIEQLPEAILDDIRNACRNKFIIALQHYFLTDVNYELSGLDIAAVKQRIRANSIFESVADKISTEEIKRNQRLVTIRNDLIGRVAEISLFERLRYKTMSVVNWQAELRLAGWQAEIVGSLTEAIFTKIKNEHSRQNPHDFKPFYQVYPVDFVSIRDNLRDVLVIIRNSAVSDVNTKELIQQFIGDLPFAEGKSPAEMLIKIYDIYKNLDIFEKMALQRIMGIPSTSFALKRPERDYGFILKPGFKSKNFILQLIIVIKAMPRTCAAMSFWTSQHAALHDSLLQVLNQLRAAEISDQSLACLLASNLFQYRQQLIAQKSVRSLKRLNEFIITQIAVKHNYCQFILTAPESALSTLCTDLITHIRSMPKTLASSSWFAAIHTELHTDTIRKLERLSVPINKEELSTILAEYHASLVAGGSIRSLSRLDDLIINMANLTMGSLVSA